MDQLDDQSLVPSVLPAQGEAQGDSDVSAPDAQDQTNLVDAHPAPPMRFLIPRDTEVPRPDDLIATQPPADDPDLEWARQAWRRWRDDFIGGVQTLFSAAVYATLIVTFGFQVARVDGLSMAPTLEDHDRLIVTNGSGIHPVPITEHILGLILAFGRGIHTQIRQQANREWQSPTWDRLFELPGKTLLLLGVGAIGERTAQMATALGMRVLGVRRDPAVAADGVAAMYGPASLPELLPQADIVVLTVPLTHETHHIIGKRNCAQ